MYSLNEAAKEFSEAAQSNNEFVEGIMFTLNKGVIMTGNMVEAPQLGDRVGSKFRESVEIGLFHDESVSEGQQNRPVA